MATVAYRLLIRGMVQGVFYRSTLRNVATKHNVLGWVRNLANGDVEAFVQGERGDVEQVVEWCRHGPREAAVEEVTIEPKQPDTEIRSFSIVL